MMKKIINGKTYNTETAVKLGYRTCGTKGDFNRIEESLYRTRKGAYFTAGTGGPATGYAVQVDQNSYTGGSAISTVTEEAARSWLELYGIDGEYETAFGPAEEA